MADSERLRNKAGARETGGVWGGRRGHLAGSAAFLMALRPAFCQGQCKT